MLDRQISRRRAIQLLGSAAASAAFVACGGTSSGTSSAGKVPSKKVSITMFVFGPGSLSVMPKAFIKDYQQRHPNVTIDVVENSNTVFYPKMLAQKKIASDQPLVNMGFFNSTITAQGDSDGMWSKIDYSALKNAADIPPAFRRANQHGIGIGADQIGIEYNTKVYSTAPTSWTQLWADGNRGKVVFLDYWWYPVFAAARLNGGSLTNMDPGWKLWHEHAKSIRAIVGENTQLQQIISSGEAALSAYFAGTTLIQKGTGAPVDYAPPSEGAIPVPVFLQTVNGNTHDQQAVCTDIIDEMLSPKWNQMWGDQSMEVPANSKAQLSGSLASHPAFKKSTVDKFLAIDWEIVGRNAAAWQQQWNQQVKAAV